GRAWRERLALQRGWGPTRQPCERRPERSETPDSPDSHLFATKCRLSSTASKHHWVCGRAWIEPWSARDQGRWPAPPPCLGPQRLATGSDRVREPCRSLLRPFRILQVVPAERPGRHRVARRRVAERCRR